MTRVDPMDPEDQRAVPAAFIAAHVRPGRIKPDLGAQELFERHELCEDIAQALAEQAQDAQRAHGIAEDEILRRIGTGLRDEASGVIATEADWVLGRLCELLDWPLPGAEEQDRQS